MDSFLERLNTFHPDIKFTHERSKTEINFLDLTVRKAGDRLITDLYCKPTDCPQYLAFNSAHPFHCKKSIVYSQGLRVKRLCSLDRDFRKHIGKLREWFIKRDYPRELIDSQLKRVMEKKRETLFAEPKEKSMSGVPLVVTYSPALAGISKIVHKHLNTLYLDTEAKRVFTPAPFVSFRNGYNLRKHLVRSKLYPLSREVGSKKCCAPRCQTCDNVTNTTSFVSSQKKVSYNINHQKKIFKIKSASRRTKQGQNCLSYVGPSIWNKLPEKIKESKSLNNFKHKIKDHF